MLRIEFETTEADFREAGTWVRPSFRAVTAGQAAALHLTAAVTSATFCAFQVLRETFIWWHLGIYALGYVSAGIGTTNLLVWKGNRAALRRMARLAREDGNAKMSVTFADDGIHIVTTETSLTVRWHRFLSAYETPTLFVLMHQRYGWTPIPKRAFRDAAETDDMCGMFAAHEVPFSPLPGKSRGFTPLVAGSTEPSA